MKAVGVTAACARIERFLTQLRHDFHNIY